MHPCRNRLKDLETEGNMCFQSPIVFATIFKTVVLGSKRGILAILALISDGELRSVAIQSTVLKFLNSKDIQEPDEDTNMWISHHVSAGI
jgi:hypothetical protein